MKTMRCSSLTPLVAMFLATPGMTCAATGNPRSERIAIEQTLHSIETAITVRDAAAAMAAYDPADPAFVAHSLNTVKGWLALDDLAVAYRVARVKTIGETAEAVVFRKVTYKEHGRRKIEPRWETIRFRKVASGWRLAAEDERIYSHCDSTDLRVELAPAAGTMRGSSTLRIGITAAGETSLLMQLNRGLEVKSLTDDRSRPVHFERDADSIVLPQLAPLEAGESRALTISFEGKLFNESKEQGYSQVSIAPAGSFASWVTNWYPRLRGTGSKSKGTITYTVPDGMIVASSGRLSAIHPEGSAQAHVFSVDRPLDFSFAAAKYFHRETTVDGIQLGVYLLRGGDAKADLYLKECARTLRYEQELYGRYPFDGYAVVEIPSSETGTLGGSSEQGMNLFPTGVLPDNAFPLLLLAHEMGHSWWGNLIRSGGAAILAEGLAQITAVLCLREFEGEKAMRSFLKSGVAGYRQSAAVYFLRFASSAEKDSPLAVEPLGSDARAAQHDIADTKGMFVYNMLREKIGHEAFVGGLRRIVGSFAGKKVTVRDLRLAMEKASGTDLGPFFQQWFYRTGAPDLVLDARVSAADSGFVVSGIVAQAGEPYDVTAEIVLASPAKRVIKTLAVSGRSTPFSFTSDEKPEFVVLDPDYKVLRWTPAFRNATLLADGIGLWSVGKKSEAVEKLQEYVAKAPESLEGRYRLGVSYEETGKLDLAESCFQFVLDRYRSLDAYEPAVTLSQLHLGHVFDLLGRRDDAKAAYRKTLVLPDESASHHEAEAGLAAPYQAAVKSAGPGPEAMARFVGTYDNDKGLTVQVTLDDQGILRAGQPGKPAGPLQWVEGSRFRISGANEITIDFVGSSEITALDLTIGAANVIHLPRKK